MEQQQAVALGRTPQCLLTPLAAGFLLREPLVQGRSSALAPAGCSQPPRAALGAGARGSRAEAGALNISHSRTWAFIFKAHSSPGHKQSSPPCLSGGNSRWYRLTKK